MKTQSRLGTTVAEIYPKLRLTVATPTNQIYTVGQTKNLVLRLREDNGVPTKDGFSTVIIVQADPIINLTFNQALLESTNPVKTLSNADADVSRLTDGSLVLKINQVIPASADIYFAVDVEAISSGAIEISSHVVLGSGNSHDATYNYTAINLSVI